MLTDVRIKQAQNHRMTGRTQVELEAARSRYFDLYDLAPVSYLTVSENDRILEANLTAANMLGLNSRELTGRSIRKFITPADQDIYHLLCKRLFETDQPQFCELRIVKQDGSRFWVHLTCTHAHTTTEIATHRVVMTDINDRKLAQEKLWVSDAALKTIRQGVLITTPGFRVVSVNDAFLSMTGYSEHEIIGSNCSFLNGPLTDALTLKTFVKAIDRNKAFSGQVLNYRKDGSCFWNELTISPVYDSQGMLTHFISINSDISDRKRLDQELHNINIELQRAAIIAEKANLAKSEFLSSMSHELRSPLNAILGFAQLLESGAPPPTPSQEGKIKQILRAGWLLLTLINEILDLASIESGKIAVSLEPLSLAAILLDCQSMIEPQASSANIVINFEQSIGPLQVIADPTRLKQVIINLLSNAIKYNRTNGTVNVAVNSDAAGTVRISVQDTGKGLSAEKLLQLFQPFNRLGQEVSNIEGTGIGLVVAKRLTELMGGKIGAQSTDGVGSVFWIELRTSHLVPVTDPARQSLALQHPELAEPDHKGGSVLYVEDNAANLELMEHILADRPKLKLITARNGTEGVEKARTEHPQVILMDINLPGISGVEVLTILRQDPATKRIPVLAISANAMPLDVVRGLQAGFFRYLTKPIKIDEFWRALDLALAAAPAVAGPAAPAFQSG